MVSIVSDNPVSESGVSVVSDNPVSESGVSVVSDNPVSESGINILDDIIDGTMGEQYRYLSIRYCRWVFSYGVLQPEDGGCFIFVLESELSRYPIPIQNFILHYDDYIIYTLYEVRRCDYCDNYIYLQYLNWYNIDNHYVCLECYRTGNYISHFVNNETGIVDHLDDISTYIRDESGNICVR